MMATKNAVGVLVLTFSCLPMLYGQATWDRLTLIRERNKDIGRSSTEMIQSLQQLSATDVARNLAVFGMTSRRLRYGHAQFMQTLDDSRTDKQVVAGSAAGGTGDAVAMPGLPGLIAYAVSTGVVTQTVNQNVVTLSANGEGLYRFIAGQNPACSGTARQTDDLNVAQIRDSCTAPTWANNLAISAAFNVGTSSKTVTGQSAATGTMQSALASVNGKDFSSASARYAITNTRSPKSPESLTKFESKVNPATYSRFTGPGAQLLAYMSKLLRSEISKEELADFHDEVPGFQIEDVRNPTISVLDAWRALIGAVGKGPQTAMESGESPEVKSLRLGFELLARKDPSFEENFAQLSDAYIRFLARDAVTTADQVYAPMLTADYTFSRPPLEPDLHTFTFVGAFSPGAKNSTSPGTLTANLGVSMYAKSQPTDVKGNTGILRNAQAAVQFDRIWKASQTPVQVSLGGYIQYQVNPGIISVPSGSTIPGTSITVPGDAMTLLGPKGLIAVAESKITLHVPYIIAPIPLGFSYSNRTDLLKGSEVRAHIAFSFDTFSLATLAAGKNP